jgi:hypothetical protein
MLKRDYLLDMIRRATDAIARAFGKVEEDKLEEAEAAARETLQLLLRMPLDAVTQLDVKTALPAIGDGDPTAVRLASRALYVLGLSEKTHDRAAQSRMLCTRAMKLYAAVGVGDDPVDRETALALAAMFRRP